MKGSRTEAKIRLGCLGLYAAKLRKKKLLHMAAQIKDPDLEPSLRILEP